jgi:hypothetical protein
VIRVGAARFEDIDCCRVTALLPLLSVCIKSADFGSGTRCRSEYPLYRYCIDYHFESFDNYCFILFEPSCSSAGHSSRVV